MAYGISFPPIHQYYIAGTATALSETATVVNNGGVYLFNCGSAAVHVRITNASDTTTPTAANGFTLTPNSTTTLYVKTGQFVHASGTGGSYTLLESY